MIPASARCLSFLLATSLLLAGTRDVLAEEDVFVIATIEEGKEPTPSSFKFNGRLSSISSANARYVLNRLDPHRPIVGATLLPPDPFFSIRFSDDPPDAEQLLEQLGEKLGLRIRTREWEGEFLTVRLPVTGIPAFWEPATGENFISGLLPIEPIPGLTRVVNLEPRAIVRELSFRIDTPLIDLTGLSRPYNLIFEDNDRDLEAAVKALGLSLERRTLKWTCVVVEKQ